MTYCFVNFYMTDVESLEVTVISEITKSDELNVSKCVSSGNVFNLILKHGHTCDVS